MSGRLLISASGGRLSIGRVKLGSGKKIAAAEAGLSEGQTFS